MMEAGWQDAPRLAVVQVVQNQTHDLQPWQLISALCLCHVLYLLAAYFVVIIILLTV